MKGPADYLALGDWNAVCFECGSKQKASKMMKHWQGYYVCTRCWEPRQPQDFVRGVPDSQAPPWTQAPPADVFVDSDVPDFDPYTPPDWNDPTNGYPETPDS